VTLLGYKGAESLPDVRGRGLIVWKGKFIEFQSFEVTYPMPSPEVLKSVTERQAAVERDAPVQDNEIIQLAESIREDWEPGLSLNKTSQLLGKPYAGASWTEKVKAVVAYLSTTTTSNSTISGSNAA
jgi:hypothetical protein